MFWLLLLASTLPYFPNETLRGTPGYLFTLSITGFTCWMYLVNPNNRNIAQRIVYNLRRSTHFLLYCLSLLVSLFSLVIVYGELEAFHIVRAIGYVVVATISYILLPVLMGPKRLRQFWWALMGIGSVCSFLGLLAVFTAKAQFLGIPIYRDDYMWFLGLYSTPGPFYGPNLFGAVVALGIVGASYFVAQKEHRIVALVAVVVCSAALLFSWSRGVYLAVAIGFAIWLWLGASQRRRQTLVLVGSFAAMLAVALVLLVPFLYGLFQVDVGGAGRDVLWSAALKAIASRPFSGYGMGNLIPTMEKFGGLHRGLAMPAHNGFLDIGVQTGAFSSLAFLFTGVISFYRLSRAEIEPAHKQSIGAGIVITFIATMFLSYSLGGASIMALTMSILWGLGNYAPVASVQWQDEHERFANSPVVEIMSSN